MIDIKAERESRLAGLHPVLRKLDAAVARYIDLVRDSPHLSDDELHDRLIELEIEDSVAYRCVTFVPLAFGRVLVNDLGVKAPDTYIEYDLSTKQQIEKPLAEQFEFIWAESVLDIYYQSPEYNSTFKEIAVRSAEVGAINNALHGGCAEKDLCKLDLRPPTVFIGESPNRWWQFWRK